MDDNAGVACTGKEKLMKKNKNWIPLLLLGLLIMLAPRYGSAATFTLSDVQYIRKIQIDERETIKARVGEPNPDTGKKEYSWKDVPNPKKGQIYIQFALPGNPDKLQGEDRIRLRNLTYNVKKIEDPYDKEFFGTLDSVTRPKPFRSPTDYSWGTYRVEEVIDGKTYYEPFMNVNKALFEDQGGVLSLEVGAKGKPKRFDILIKKNPDGTFTFEENRVPKDGAIHKVGIHKLHYSHFEGGVFVQFGYERNTDEWAKLPANYTEMRVFKKIGDGSDRVELHRIPVADRDFTQPEQFIALTQRTKDTLEGNTVYDGYVVVNKELFANGESGELIFQFPDPSDLSKTVEHTVYVKKDADGKLNVYNPFTPEAQARKEEAGKLKEALENYVNAVDTGLLGEITTPENQSAIDAFKQKLQEAKNLYDKLVPPDVKQGPPESVIDAAKKLLGDVGNQYAGGSLTEAAKKITVKYDSNPDMLYSNGGTIEIKSSIQGLTKDPGVKRLYLETVEKCAESTARPVATDTYKMEKTPTGYEITLPADPNKAGTFVIPEHVRALRPVLEIRIAPGVTAKYYEDIPVEKVPGDEDPANPQEVEEVVEKIKAYLKDVDEDALDEMTNAQNSGAVKSYKRLLKRIKDIADKKEQGHLVFQQDVNRAKECLGYDANDAQRKWKPEIGALYQKAQAIEMDFVVDGSRTEKDQHNPAVYPAVATQNGVIKVKTGLRGLKNDPTAVKRIYLQSISKTNYQAENYDGSDFPVSNYTIAEDADGYTITIPNVPADVAILKPVIEVSMGTECKLTGSDLVFAKEGATPSPGGSNPPAPPAPNPSVPFVPGGMPLVPPVSPSNGEMKIPAEDGSGAYAVAPAKSMDAATRVRIVEKENGKKDVILVDGNGNEVYSDELMLVTIPAPAGQEGSYRVKVNGVYTTFELSEDGRYVTMPMVFTRDGRMREDVILTQDGVSVKGSQNALPGTYRLSVTDHGSARYTVDLLDGEGKKTSSEGPVMVTMPAPEGAGEVYRVRVDGKWTTFEIENGMIRFAMVF